MSLKILQKKPRSRQNRAVNGQVCFIVMCVYSLINMNTCENFRCIWKRAVWSWQTHFSQILVYVNSFFIVEEMETERNNNRSLIATSLTLYREILLNISFHTFFKWLHKKGNIVIHQCTYIIHVFWWNKLDNGCSAFNMPWLMLCGLVKLIRTCR